MNILTELLPGARQLRAPLAIGYLWLFAVWINDSRLPHNIRHSDLVVRAVADAYVMTPLLLIVITSFVAYVVGLLMQIFDDFIVKVMAIVTPIAFLLACMALVVFLWPVSVPTAAIIIGLSLWWRRRAKELVIPEIKQRLISITLPVAEVVYTLLETTQRIWFPARLVKNKLVSEKLAELLDRNPDARQQFCDTLTLVRLRIACHVAGLSAGSVSLTTSEGDVVNVSKAAARVTIDRENEHILRQYLLERLEESHETSAEVAFRVMHKADVRGLIDRALENTESWLRAEKPNVFEACDRLRAEAEFRCGLAVPLAAVFCSICALFTANIYYALAPVLLVIPIYFSGLKKNEDAIGIVVGCVSAGITSVKLDLTDPRLLRWANPENAMKKDP